MSVLLLIALQATQPTAAAGPPERFSILAPVPTAPCRPKDAGADEQDDVVVCASPEATQRLPLPAERGPSLRPRASNPDVSGAQALAAAAPVCAAQQGGCQTGVDVFGAGTAAVRLIQKLVAPGSCCEDAGESTNPLKLVGDMAGDVGRAFRGKRDTSDRMPIDLSEPAPTTVRAQP